MTLALLALLAAAPCEHPAVGRLSSRQQEAACALLAREAPPHVDRAALEAVYLRPGFERARDRETGALQVFLAQLRAWFERLFETSGAETYSNVTRVLVLFVAALVGAWAALRLAARKWRATPAATAAAAAALVLDSPAQHLDRARAALGEDPRRAIREGLFALLAFLERERLARPDRVTTNRELARELPSRGAAPALTQGVTRLLEWYDGAFYSLEPIAPEAARRFVDDVEALARPAEAAP